MKTIMQNLLLVALPIFILAQNATYEFDGKGNMIYSSNWKIKPGTPVALKDSSNGNIYYLESDGRHVSAINRNGKILWNTDPFEAAKLRPYRFERPVISYFEFNKENRKLISIIYNSSQFGDLDKRTGNFKWLGQD